MKQTDAAQILGLSGEITPEAVKRAHKSHDLIIRLVEERGSRSRAELVSECCMSEIDLIEIEGHPLASQELFFKSFEIKSLRLSNPSD